jgi:hypothetical protein
MELWFLVCQTTTTTTTVLDVLGTIPMWVMMIALILSRCNQEYAIGASNNALL